MCKRSNNVQIRGRRDKQNIHRRVFSGGANDHEAMMERWGEARRRGRGRGRNKSEEEEGKGGRGSERGGGEGMTMHSQLLLLSLGHLTHAIGKNSFYSILSFPSKVIPYLSQILTLEKWNPILISHVYSANLKWGSKVTFTNLKSLKQIFQDNDQNRISRLWSKF